MTNESPNGSHELEEQLRQLKPRSIDLNSATILEKASERMGAHRGSGISFPQHAIGAFFLVSTGLMLLLILFVNSSLQLEANRETAKSVHSHNESSDSLVARNHSAETKDIGRASSNAGASLSTKTEAHLSQPQESHPIDVTRSPFGANASTNPNAGFRLQMSQRGIVQSWEDRYRTEPLIESNPERRDLGWSRVSPQSQMSIHQMKREFDRISAY